MICKVAKKHERTRFAEIRSRDQTIFWQGRLSAATDKLFDEHGLTFFIDCTVRDGHLHFGALAPKEDW